MSTRRVGRLVRTRGCGVKRAPVARAERGGGQVEYKNKKWWVRRSASEGDGPRRRWREGPYATQDEADAACSKATLTYTAATPIGEWLDGWVEKEAKRALLGQREDHARRVRTDVNHVKPYLHNVRIGDVKPSDWMDVWDELLTVPSEKTGKPLSRKTVGRCARMRRSSISCSTRSVICVRSNNRWPVSAMLQLTCGQVDALSSRTGSHDFVVFHLASRSWRSMCLHTILASMSTTILSTRS